MILPDEFRRYTRVRDRGPVMPVKSDIEAFVAAGGEIRHLEIGESGLSSAPKRQVTNSIIFNRPSL